MMRDKTLASVVIVLSILAGIVTTALVLTESEEEPIDVGPPFQPPRVGNTTAEYVFLKIQPDPKPTDLKVVLELNGTDYGVYVFQSDEDGLLAFENGVDVCDMEYVDLADNEKVNVGDTLRLTELSPDSQYVLRLIWAPTGDVITTWSFSTLP